MDSISRLAGPGMVIADANNLDTDVVKPFIRKIRDRTIGTKQLNKFTPASLDRRVRNGRDEYNLPLRPPAPSLNVNQQ